MPPTATPTPEAAVGASPEQGRTGAAEAAPKSSPAELKREALRLKRKVRETRAKTWHWQDSSVSRRSGTKHQEHYLNKPWKLKLLLKQWQKRLKQAKYKALHPPNKWAWFCIHRHERDPNQGWRTNTGNGYYGGLQMDMDFMFYYGRHLLTSKRPKIRLWTANNWPWYTQIWVAEKARASGRGFRPWPNTARMCGLL